MYTFSLTESEMAFFRELFQSQLAITLDKVEIVASVKKKVLSAEKLPDPPTVSES